jgi:Ca2+-binding RTX toxin-like protein
MRAPLALAGLALMAAGLPLAPPAQAAVEMCQGKEATIVSVSGEQVVNGTGGDDVIVVRDDSDGRIYALNLDAKGGDDLICISGQLDPDVVGEGGALVYGGAGEDSLQVRGSNGRDKLFLNATIEKVDIKLFGGFDDVRLYGAGEFVDLRAGSASKLGTVDGGAGPDTIEFYNYDEVRVDLGDERLVLDGTREYGASGFNRVIAAGRRVILRGDAKANGFASSACRTTLKGSGGNDVLQASINKSFEDCTPKGAYIFGEKGDDRMTGTVRGDVLSGGAGRDTANGGKGNDRCVAEKQKACER